MNQSRARSSDHDPNMYDDYPAMDDQYRHSPSQSYQNLRKGDTRAPSDLPAGDRAHQNYPEQSQRGGHRSELRYDRSRSPRRESRYTDRDREGYESPPRRRSRSRSRSPYYGGPPNRSVILDGLAIEMTQEDGLAALASLDLQILNELKQSLHVEGLDEVRVIRDRRTGHSRQFAFAQFVDIPAAKQFLERFYPSISIYGAYDPNQVTPLEPVKVRVAYSRDKEDKDKPGKGEDDWKCEVCFLANFSHRTLCFRCNAPRTRATAHGVVIQQTSMSANPEFATTGESDASLDGTASQFLLLRGLEPGVSEELLARGVIKLYKSSGITPPTELHSSKKNKSKITSSSQDASLGAKEGSLRRVLLVRDRKSNDSWRYGFAEFNSVEDAQAAVAKYHSLGKFTISSKPVSVSYIHAGVFVPVLRTLGDDASRFTFSPLTNAAVQLMYWDEAAYVSELVTAPIDGPSMPSHENERAKLVAAAMNEGLIGAGKEGEPRGKKRKVEKEPVAGNKKAVAPHLQFWTNQHAELHGLPPKGDEADKVPPTLSAIPKKQADTIQNPPSRSFADLQRKCCLLCSRQFKTEAEVNKHERISQLHRDNLKNEELVAKTSTKLNKAGDSEADNAAYRDRAKERRQAFNQPKQPAPQRNRPGQELSAGKTSKEEAAASAPIQSKGAALLEKMGWTSGAGLGAQGEGRTEAITTDLYTQGVGLGAAGGKVGDAVEEAQRQTKGSYADFLEKTKDKAKERFESLG